MGGVAFVLGKRPRPTTVVARVIDSFRADAVDVTVHLPHDRPGPLPAAVLDGDLVVQRGLLGHVLADLLRLETAGVRCCNPIAATIATADRLSVARRLSAAGIAVPATRPAATWADVLAAAAAGPVVVKSRDGGVGRGAGVVITEGRDRPPAAALGGPWVLQEVVPDDGLVRKCYVAGSSVRTLAKPSLTAGRHERPPGPPLAPASLADLALATGAAIGLEIYNVDVILGPDGPRVVDVNPFPGFRGIPDAAVLVADHLRSRCVGPASG